jgi:hypothetical protein
MAVTTTPANFWPDWAVIVPEIVPVVPANAG